VTPPPPHTHRASVARDTTQLFSLCLRLGERHTRAQPDVFKKKKKSADSGAETVSWPVLTSLECIVTNQHLF